MTQQEIEEEIIALIPASGIKASLLVTRIIIQISKEEGECIPKILYDVDIPELLESLVQQGKIREVEYVELENNYRIKSLYFPKDAVINIKVNDINLENVTMLNLNIDNGKSIKNNQSED